MLKLSKLSKLSKPSKLSKLSKLSELSKLSKLHKLRKLSKLSSALPLSLSFSPSLASRMLVRSAPAGSRPPCPFRCSLRLLSLSMGSLGWADCYWCKRRHYNMYIPDGISQPLCEVCLDRWCDGLRPPRQPDARERLVRLLRPAIGCIPADIVAQLLRHDWEP